MYIKQSFGSNGAYWWEESWNEMEDPEIQISCRGLPQQADFQWISNFSVWCLCLTQMCPLCANQLDQRSPRCCERTHGMKFELQGKISRHELPQWADSKWISNFSLQLHPSNSDVHIVCQSVEWLSMLIQCHVCQSNNVSKDAQNPMTFAMHCDNCISECNMFACQFWSGLHWFLPFLTNHST